MELQRVGYDWATFTHGCFTFLYSRNWQSSVKQLYSNKENKHCFDSTFIKASISSVWLPSYVQLFETPWTAACQASRPITNSRSLLKFMSIQSVMPSISSYVVRFSSCLQSFPASASLQMSQLFTSGGQSIGDSASTSVLPVNTQGWSPLGWIGCISFQSKGLSRVFSNITVQKHQFFGTQLTL